MYILVCMSKVVTAQAETQIERNKTIDALTYFGLAVSRIAAVGPTLKAYDEVN